MKDHELRFSDTNSADDSEGKTWGLDGNLFWFVVAGVFLFVVTLLLLFSVARCIQRRSLFASKSEHSRKIPSRMDVVKLSYLPLKRRNVEAQTPALYFRSRE